MTKSALPLLLLFFLLFLLPAPSPSDARTWLVRQDGSGDCTAIQACIELAHVADTVLVGPGTYYEHILISNRASGVRVIGEMGPVQTVIDGGNSWRVVTIDSVGVGTSLQGFTIQNGSLAEPFAPGAGICCTYSSVLIEGNIIAHNTCRADGDVAGIYCGEGSSTIRRNLIIRNSSECTCAGVVLFNDGSTIEQNTIAYNSAPTTGGIYAITSSSVIAKNIVVYNEGYGIKCAGASAGLSLICNDLWENTRGNYYRCDPGEEDISVDSQFCDASRDDFSLCASSPCVNAPDCGQIGALGVGCGPTGVKETTWGRIKAMFR